VLEMTSDAIHSITLCIAKRSQLDPISESRFFLYNAENINRGGATACALLIQSRKNAVYVSAIQNCEGGAEKMTGEIRSILNI
jgi:hypothetical protein